MDVPMSWLKEYAAVTAPLKDFMEDMTMSGSKVEGATSMAGELKTLSQVISKPLKNTPTQTNWWFAPSMWALAKI